MVQTTSVLLRHSTTYKLYNIYIPRSPSEKSIEKMSRNHIIPFSTINSPNTLRVLFDKHAYIHTRPHTPPPPTTPQRCVQLSLWTTQKHDAITWHTARFGCRFALPDACLVRLRMCTKCRGTAWYDVRAFNGRHTCSVARLRCVGVRSCWGFTWLSSSASNEFHKLQTHMCVRCWFAC